MPNNELMPNNDIKSTGKSKKTLMQPKLANFDEHKEIKIRR